MSEGETVVKERLWFAKNKNIVILKENASIKVQFVNLTANTEHQRNLCTALKINRPVCQSMLLLL